MAVGLRALGVRLHVVAVLEVLVHDLALRGAHGVERDRAAAAHGVVGRLVGLAVERLGAAVAVAGGVDDHPLRPVLRGGGGAVGQVLHRVDGGAVAADEEPEVAGGGRPRKSPRSPAWSVARMRPSSCSISTSASRARASLTRSSSSRTRSAAEAGGGATRGGPHAFFFFA